MSTLIAVAIATALTLQPADSITLSGDVVDPADKPIAGAEVVLTRAISRGWIIPNAGTHKDRRSRRVPPRGRPRAH